MAIKLIKACKELNVGMSKVWYFCKEHGIEIAVDPCTLIDDDLYLLLASEFNKDLEIKLRAEQQEKERQEDETMEVFTLPKVKLKNAPKVIGRIDLSQISDKKNIQDLQLQ